MRLGSYHNHLARILGKPKQLLSDREIVHACTEGRSIAWNALIERYEGLIYSVTRRMGLSEQDSGDVFQEVCLILLNHLHELRHIERLGGWLVTTTRREVLRLLRRRPLLNEADLTPLSEGMESPLALLPDPDGTPEERLLELERGRLVSQGMVNLSPECQRLLTLLYVNDPPATYQEVAETIKRPIGSIGPSRARCLKNLQEILQNLGW